MYTIDQLYIIIYYIIIFFYDIYDIWYMNMIYTVYNYIYIIYTSSI